MRASEVMDLAFADFPFLNPSKNVKAAKRQPSASPMKSPRRKTSHKRRNVNKGPDHGNKRSITSFDGGSVGHQTGKQKRPEAHKADSIVKDPVQSVHPSPSPSSSPTLPSVAAVSRAIVEEHKQVKDTQKMPGRSYSPPWIIDGEIVGDVEEASDGAPESPAKPSEPMDQDCVIKVHGKWTAGRSASPVPRTGSTHQASNDAEPSAVDMERITGVSRFFAPPPNAKEAACVAYPQDTPAFGFSSQTVMLNIAPSKGQPPRSSFDATSDWPLAHADDVTRGASKAANVEQLVSQALFSDEEAQYHYISPARTGSAYFGSEHFVDELGSVDEIVDPVDYMNQAYDPNDDEWMSLPPQLPRDVGASQMLWQDPLDYTFLAIDLDGAESVPDLANGSQGFDYVTNHNPVHVAGHLDRCPNSYEEYCLPDETTEQVSLHDDAAACYDFTTYSGAAQMTSDFNEGAEIGYYELDDEQYLDNDANPIVCSSLPVQLSPALPHRQINTFSEGALEDKIPESDHDISINRFRQGRALLRGLEYAQDGKAAEVDADFARTHWQRK